MSDKTILCPKCKEEVKKGASKCKHCSADLRNWFSRHPIITLIIGLFIVGNVMGSIITPGSGTDSSNGTQNNESFKKDPMELCIYSQKEVPQLLKSPTTANFPSCSNVNLDGIQLIKFDTPDLFAYQGYVDAQNSFGAELREQYWCGIQYKSYPEYAIKCIVSEPNSKQEMKEVFRAISVPEDELSKL